MAMLCRAIQRTTHLRVTGLCHSVQGTAMMLAKWLGATMDRVTYVSAGINHQAWYTEFQVDRKDAYPRLRKVVQTNRKIYNHEIVRNEMFLHLGYYVTESSGHNSEYNWWFRKRPDLIKKYCTHGTGWNPGAYAYILRFYEARERNWKKDIRTWFAKGAPMSLDRGLEYAASIINAYLGGEPFLFHGNVPNTGLIENLPYGACVEVPVVADRRGFNSIHVGKLPPQCAALNQISVAVEEMAVEAALTGDPMLVYHACAYDPLSAAVLSLAEIKKMVAEMLKKNRAHLPQFKGVSI
jgi:alpha-galactosidase